MATPDPSYNAYVKFAGMVGSPILDYEPWARLRYRLDSGETETQQQRKKLVAETLHPSTSQRLVPHGSESGAASANLPSSPAPFNFKPVLAATAENPGTPCIHDPTGELSVCARCQ